MTMKIWAFYIAGALLAIIGLIWVGQGSGYFPYPGTSFMVNDRTWELRGGAVVVVGLLLVAAGRYYSNHR